MKFWIDFLGNLKFSELFSNSGEMTHNVAEFDTSIGECSQTHFESFRSDFSSGNSSSSSFDSF